MNKKLQELKYDLDRETDDEKSHELIENYVYAKKNKERLDKYGTGPEYIKKPGNHWNPDNKKSELKNIVNRAIGESDECTCVKCSTSKEIENVFVPDLARILLYNTSDDEVSLNKLKCEFRKNDTPSIEEARKVLRDAFMEDDEKNNDRNREALNGLYGEGRYGNKYSVQDARKVLRDAFTEDPDFKNSYIANIKMFLHARNGNYIDDEIISDMIDFIFREKEMI